MQGRNVPVWGVGTTPKFVQFDHMYTDMTYKKIIRDKSSDITEEKQLGHYLDIFKVCLMPI